MFFSGVEEIQKLKFSYPWIKRFLRDHKLQRLRQKPSKNIQTTEIHFENLPEWKGLLLNG